MKKTIVKLPCMLLVCCFLLTVTIHNAEAFPQKLCPTQSLDTGTFIGEFSSANGDTVYIRTDDSAAHFLFMADMPKGEAKKTIAQKKGMKAKISYSLEQKLNATGKQCIQEYKIQKIEDVPQDTPLSSFEKLCTAKVYSKGLLEGIFEDALEADYATIFLRVDGERFSLLGSPEKIFGKRPNKGDKVSVNLQLERFWDWEACTTTYSGTSGKILTK